MNRLLPIVNYVTQLHNTVLSISNIRLTAFITDPVSCCGHGSPVGVVMRLQN